MTQPPPPPPPPQASQGQQDQALALAAAAALAGTATVAAAAAILVPAFAAYKIRRKAVTAALEIVMGHPPDAEGFHGPAGAQVARLNLMRRAAFLVASARRVSADLGRIASGQGGSLAEAVTRERRLYGQHLVAGWARTRAGAAADSASMLYGRLLGWHAVIDSRTSPECLWANRRNFWADQMPRFGFPGMVHPYCRCLPGAPFPGAPVIGAARVADRGSRRGIPGHGRSVPDHRPDQEPARAGIGR